MTRFEFRCALGAIAALTVAALASGAGRPVALFLCLIAAALALYLWRQSKRDRGAGQ